MALGMPYPWGTPQAVTNTKDFLTRVCFVTGKSPLLQVLRDLCRSPTLSETPFPCLSPLCQRKRRIPTPIKMSSLARPTAPAGVSGAPCVLYKGIWKQRGMVPCAAEGNSPRSQAQLCASAGAAAGKGQIWSIPTVGRKMWVAIADQPRAHLRAGPFGLEVSAAIQELRGLLCFSRSFRVVVSQDWSWL